MAVKNVVVILLDSLNRHMLGAYGGTEFSTPNLDRFALRASQFTSHVTGSLPCMPARHDILVGSLDFLWKPWGSIELWEESITAALRRANVTTMLVSDHPHLFETGGENYHVDFSAWDYLRGHEGDPWKTYVDPSAHGAPTIEPGERPLITNAADGGWYLRDQMGIADRSFGRRHYDDSRTWYRTEEDFPGPRTMASAASWLRHASQFHDRWMLFVDEFDPHEPFDTPEPWASMYDDDPLTPDELDSGRLVWPPYVVGGTSTGKLTERQARQIRNNYGAKLSMIDEHFGKILDELDAQDLWDDTAVIVCTDHGHYLGDRRSTGEPGNDDRPDIWGKPAIPQFEPLGHTPLMIHWPGAPRREIGALSTNVDIHATIADAFGVEAEHRTHGRSLVPLLDRRGGVGARLGDRRRVRQLGPGHRRTPQVRAGTGRRQPATVDVVEPMVDDADRSRAGAVPRLSESRPSGDARLHARLGRPGHPPAVRSRRPAPLLGRRAPATSTVITSTTSTSTPTRPRTGATRRPSSARWSTCCAPLWSKSTRPTSNSPGSASPDPRAARPRSPFRALQ